MAKPPPGRSVRGLVQLMPSRHLLAAMAIIVFVLGFNGLSLAQSVDLSTPEKAIDAYYSALNRSDVPAFMATLLNPGDPSGMSFGVPRTRSEERRVGKECRSRWSTEQ